MEFSKPEHWSGQPFTSPWGSFKSRDLPNPQVTPLSPAQKFLDTPGSLEGNTEGSGPTSSEPLLPS